MATGTPLKIDVFRFEDPREFLLAVLQNKQARHRGFSLRAWSKQLGLPKPSYLSSVLAGKRRLKPELAERLRKNLALRGNAARYFEALVLRAAAKTETEVALTHELMHRAAMNRKAVHLSLDKFRLISDWYHLVLLEVLNLPTLPLNRNKSHSAWAAW